MTVPDGLAAAPLDEPRQVLVPSGWTMSVFARVPSARLAAWAPDGTLLVSVPEDGSVVRLTPDGRGTATVSVLLDGLNQPHGLTFAGTTLYVAQSDRVDAYSYAGGAADRPAARRHRAARREEPGPEGPVRARAQERGRRSRRGGLRVGRVDRQHLRGRPRRDPAPGVDPARPARWRRARAVRGGGAQRDRPRGRPGRRGVDGGEQPGQHPVPVRPALRRRLGLVAGSR